MTVTGPPPRRFGADLGTIIGLALGTLLVIAAVTTGQNASLFLDAPSAIIVLGGTLGVTLMKNPLERVFRTLAIVRKAFNTSSNALLEIQWYLFSAVFLLGAGYAFLAQ